MLLFLYVCGHLWLEFRIETRGVSLLTFSRSLRDSTSDMSQSRAWRAAAWSLLCLSITLAPPSLAQPVAVEIQVSQLRVSHLMRCRIFAERQRSCEVWCCAGCEPVPHWWRHRPSQNGQQFGSCWRCIAVFTVAQICISRAICLAAVTGFTSLVGSAASLGGVNTVSGVAFNARAVTGVSSLSAMQGLFSGNLDVVGACLDLAVAR